MGNGSIKEWHGKGYWNCIRMVPQWYEPGARIVVDGYSMALEEQWECMRGYLQCM